MDKIGLPMFLIFFLFQFNFPKAQADDVPSNVNCLNILVHSNCQLIITAESTKQINITLSNPKSRFVHLNPIVRPYYSDEFWRTKNTSDEIGKYFWVWTDGDIGRRFLSLDYDFVEMSLWTLSPGVEKINVDLQEVQQGCWVTLNVTEQFCILASLFFRTIREMSVTQYHLQGSTFCYDNLDSSTYRCSNVSNVSNLNFSLEATRLVKFYILQYIIVAIYIYFLPSFFVSLFPELYTVRYSELLQGNMKKFEINYPTAKTPLGDVFSFHSQVLAFTVVIFIYVLVNIPLVYVICMTNIFHRDHKNMTYSNPIFFATVLPVLFLFEIIATAFLVWQSISEFEECKKIINSIANSKSEKLRCVLRLQSTDSIIDCVISSNMGDYISLKNNVRRNWSEATELVVDLLSSCLKRENRCCSVFEFTICLFWKVIIGLPAILCCTSPLVCVVSEGIPLKKKKPCGSLVQQIIVVSIWIGCIIAICVWSSLYWISIVTTTLAGVIINYDIILPYVMLGLSVLYYVWRPFHDVQEKYRVLKMIAFKECSISDLKKKKVKLVQNTNSSDSNATPNTEKKHNGENESADSGNSQATGNLQTSTPELSHSSTTALNVGSDDKENVDTGNVQRVDSKEALTREQDDEQYVKLYKSDKSGWERIPKGLWVEIYKALLPLNIEMAKALISSIAAVVMTSFLMFTLMDFHKFWELEIIGQGVASLITVSIPELVLGFVNTDVSKDSLKRSWEIAVRKIIKKYIKDNEIPA